MNKGWECPRCGSIYAPFWHECTKCNKREPELKDIKDYPIENDIKSIGPEISEAVDAKVPDINSQWVKLTKYDTNYEKYAQKLALDGRLCGY